MPYPGQFVRLVVIGKVYDEDFNFGLSIVPSGLGEILMPAVDTTTLAAVAAQVALWFPATAAGVGPNFTTQARLTAIKLNRIGADGRYVDNIAREHIYPSPIPGGVTIPAARTPPQIAHVVSLLTAIERGRGSKGRVYLPTKSEMQLVGTDGRITAAGALASANGVRDLILKLNTVYTAIGKVGVASNAGAGRFEHVTRLAAGRVLDTMRSRRADLLEDYQEVPL